MFELFMFLMGSFVAWGISATLSEKGIGTKIFFWVVLVVCSFSVGGSLVVTIGAVWHTPVVLKAELHGLEIANMFIATATIGMCFLFGFNYLMKILVASIKNNFQANKALYNGSSDSVVFVDPLAENYTLDQKRLLEELEAHRNLFKSVYHYTGSYPVWKVQQEFRELVESLKPDSVHCLWHFHNLDRYLSKLVDETDKLRQYHDETYTHGHGWGEMLSGARGDHLLDAINQKHPNLQKTPVR